GQGFETGFDQFNCATAQNSLFTKQIGLGFFTEVGFNDTGTAATVRHRIRQRDVTSHTRLVLIDSDQVRNTTALRVCTTNGVTRSLRSNHDDVEVSTWHNLTVMHVEAMCK